MDANLAKAMAHSSELEQRACNSVALGQLEGRTSFDRGPAAAGAKSVVKFVFLLTIKQLKPGKAHFQQAQKGMSEISRPFGGRRIILRVSVVLLMWSWKVIVSH